MVSLALTRCILQAKNLKTYSQFECNLSIDWHQNPNIDIYNDRGLYKSLYENLEDCELALK